MATEATEQAFAATDAKNDEKDDSSSDSQAQKNESGSDAKDQAESHYSGFDADVDSVPTEVGSTKPKKKKKSMNKQEKKKRKRAQAAAAAANAGQCPHEYLFELEKILQDKPMTAQEAQDEKALYAVDRPFFERIETCIQRYLARRRFNNDQRKIFDLYLFLGGIDSSPRQFNGSANLEKGDMSKQEARDASSLVAIPRAGGSAKFYTPGDENWDVDFLGILKGFFGETLLAHTGFDLRDIRAGVLIVDNFLRYVAYHDVCPEYRMQLRDAIDFCNQAWRDLCDTWEVMSAMPGEFNIAAVRLFKSALMDNSVLDADPEKDFSPNLLWSIVLCDREGMEREEFYNNWPNMRGYVFDKEEDRSFEVVDVIPPTEKHVKEVQAATIRNKLVHSYPVMAGILVKDVCIRDGWHVSEEWEKEFKPVFHILYIEDMNCDKFKPGMKLRVRVAILNNGTMFVTKPYCAMPEWYVFLPQNLMRDYVQPAPLPVKDNYESDTSTKVDED